MTLSGPTVLWRLQGPSGELARAVIIPGEPQSTLAVFVNDVMDRAENYDELGLALYRADDIKGSLLGTGWREER
jgi:hypothetical protein